MSDQNDNPATSRKWSRPVLTGFGAAAAFGIAAMVYFGNAGPTPETDSCPALAEAAAAIDSVATGELAALTPTGTGRSYKDLEFIDDTGRPMTLADFSGRPLLVNFWATWCAPCRAEMPALDALSAAYSDDVFSVVPINLDTGSEGVTLAQQFLTDEGLGNLPLLADPSFKAFDRLKKNGVALGLPATILLDANGCEIATLQGPAEWNSKDAHNVIDALIRIGSDA